MQLAEDYIRYLCQYLLDHCGEDLELMKKLYDKTCIDRLTAVASTPFGRVSYTEAIDILLKVRGKGEGALVMVCCLLALL